MGRPVRVLLIEDSETDAELLLHELSRGGFDVFATRVDTAAAMEAALASATWDIVVSDYSMPSFSGPHALELLHRTALDLPFIIVSGTIGEETAVASLRAGACDFLVKGRLTRLVPAIDRELREADLRREHARTQQALEEQLRHTQKMQAIGRLAGGVAHDFNNMLTAILGYAELLTQQIGPDKPIGQDLHEIVTAAQRAADLTRQLLAFSRKQTNRPVALSLNAVVVQLEPMLRRLIHANINIQATLDPETQKRFSWSKTNPRFFHSLRPCWRDMGIACWRRHPARQRYRRRAGPLRTIRRRRTRVVRPSLPQTSLPRIIPAEFHACPSVVVVWHRGARHRPGGRLN